MSSAGPQPSLSVVIPTLNEADRIAQLLQELRRLGPRVELIVSDGGSTDRTVEIARSHADLVVEGGAGRGAQLNRGAAAARGAILFFVHADSRFDTRALRTLQDWLADLRSLELAGVFRFALDAPGFGWRVLEWGQGWRHRLLGVAFGDQGLVLPRSLFAELGGYPDLPVMEDASLMKALRRATTVHTLPAPLPTSPRRYQREGRVRAVLRNQVLLGLHALGVHPRRLAGAYRPNPKPQPGQSTTPYCDQTLLIFAKAPVPGRVKTRLAAAVGPEIAARFYKVLGSMVVKQVGGGAHETVVCFDPPDAEAEVRAWLGPELKYRAQSEGDLGDRMDDAVRQALVGGGSAVVIGTDAPDVDASTVSGAFAALGDHDLVLGPAEDGGYYLIGLNRPNSTLFQGIPWSTDRVFEVTVELATRAGLRIHLLPTLRDVDRLADVPESLRYVLEP